MEAEVFDLSLLWSTFNDHGTKTPTLGAQFFLALKSMTEPAD